MGRPRIIETPEEFVERAEAYFALCAEREMPTTITGLALALGFAAVQSLHDYEARPEFSDAVKRARLIIQNDVETRLFMTDKPTASIFWLKSQAGWVDKQTVEHQGEIKGGVLAVPMPLDADEWDEHADGE